MDNSSLNNEIVKRSVPFVDMDDFSPLIKSLKDKQVVMLGESTHGTREFYEWRSLISAELIQNHGFSFIAVEGDWPACEAVNKHIQEPSAKSSFETLGNFSRWPTWMWGNQEMVKLMDWLVEWNASSSRKIGFHGLDVYSLYESIDEIIHCLKKADPALARKAQEYYSCFDPFRHDERAYASSLFKFPQGCEREVRMALEEILVNGLDSADEYFDMAQNARIIQNAERYYRAVVLNGNENSWNIRDKHMMDTLENLLKHYGPSSKGIVWAHNTHIGDYRATDMALRGEVNLGGLAREKFGREQVALVGFTTYTGSVIASHAWDGIIEVMEVPMGKTGSIESHLHDCIPMVGHENYYVTFGNVEKGSALLDYRGHRAIGVVYYPEYERGNYVPSSIAERYDALVFLDETKALSPLGYSFDRKKIPETYPFGSRL